MLSSPSAGVLTEPDDLIQRLQRLFAQQPAGARAVRLADSSIPLREAAVLIPVLRPRPATGPQVLFTLRSANLPSHAGQVSLPGGTRDEGDRDAIHTALREAEEEVGLPSTAVQILGQLPSVDLPSGYRVTPVVGLLDASTPLKPCPREVAEIFAAPAQLVLSPQHYERCSMQHNQRSHQVLQLHYQQYRIWGATAAILHGLGRSLQRLPA